jgi:hypothetical protein
VPPNVAEKLAAPSSASLPHLCDLGLVDVLTDMVDRRQSAFAVNGLAAGRLKPLGDRERGKVASAVAHELFGAWGDAKGTGSRPFACDLQLTQLGRLAEDGEIVECCAARAVFDLRRGSAAGAAATLGLSAIGLLDKQLRVVPWRLLSETAAAVGISGHGATADTLLDRGIMALEKQRRTGAVVDPTAAGFLVYEQARRLLTRGQLDQAENLFMETARLAAAVGNEINVATARSKVADILYRRGDLDGALRIRRD